MSREIIAYEGREVVPGQLMELNSLTWTDEPIPVVRSPIFSEPGDVIGYATELRREEDGSITAELGIGEYSILLDHDVAATIYINKAKWEGGYELKTVTEGVIRGVFLTPDVPWVGKRPGDKL